ncbi:MAG TPA: hypothetical protein VMU51_14585, partial [Mycobacteriales bacterium]|nr:hypothetical protein [Mycobacteriales bacterium]
MTGPRPRARTRVTSRLTRLVRGVGRCLGVVGRLVAGMFAAVVLVALLAGVPWAAVRWVGWPLPHHVPTWDEVQTVLSQPASTSLVVNILTCLGWLLWAAFAVDVARSGIAAARAARWPQAPTMDLPGGPVQALAAALVGAIVLTLLGNRTLTTPTRADAPDPADRPAAAATRLAGSAPTSHTLTFTGDPGEWTAPGPHPTREAQLSSRPSVVVVRAAAGGIHDSLWRITQRALGDGARWPEIYQANKGRLQPDGRRLASPNLIYPGWRLTLPNPPHHGQPSPPRPGDGGHHGGRPTPAPRPTAPPAPTPTPRSTPVPPSPSAPATPAPTSPPLPSAPPTPTGDAGSRSPSSPAGSAGRPPAARPAPGVELPGGGYVGLGLAGLITAAALALRQWRRTHPTADLARREEDTDMAPVVRALRLAHAEAHHSHQDPASSGNPAALPDTTTRALPVAEPVVAGAGQPAVEGVRDGLTQALELAGSRGLGLIGDGAPDAARALLVSLLAGRHHVGAGPVEVLVPADALTAVLPTAERAGRPWPTRLRVTRDLDTALDTAEVELVTRARLSAERRASLGALVILASPQPHAERRLQAVLDNGSTLGIAGVLIGQWRPGGTVRVRADGTVAAASPDIADTLDQTRLFTLPTRHTTDLLDLLAAADPAAADRDDTHTDPTDTDQPDTGQTESAGQSPSPDDTGSRPARQPDTGAGTATAALVDRVATGPAPRRTEASAGLHADRLGPAAASGPVGMDLELGRPPGRAEDDRAGPPAPRHTLGGGRHPTDGGPASAGPPAAADSDDAGGRQAAVR